MSPESSPGKKKNKALRRSTMYWEIIGRVKRYNLPDKTDYFANFR